MICVPQSMVIIKLASDKSGPKGMPSLRVFSFVASRMIATTPAENYPSKTATITLGKTVIKPIIPAIFTSPQPIPFLLMIAGRQRMRKPTAPPSNPKRKLCRLNKSGTKKLTINRNNDYWIYDFIKNKLVPSGQSPPGRLTRRCQRWRPATSSASRNARKGMRPVDRCQVPPRRCAAEFLPDSSGSGRAERDS